MLDFSDAEVSEGDEIVFSDPFSRDEITVHVLECNGSYFVAESSRDTVMFIPWAH